MTNESACAAPLHMAGVKITKASLRPKPFKVARYLQSDGGLVKIVPISTDIEGQNVTSIFAKAEISAKPKAKHSIHSRQGERMAKAFIDAPDTDIPAVELHRIGSGKPNGFLASFSRRISDLRSQNLNIVKSVDKIVDGIRHTSYRYVKNIESYE